MSESTKEPTADGDAKRLSLALPAFQELADLAVERAHKNWLEGDCPGLLFKFIARDIDLAELFRVRHALRVANVRLTAERDALQGELERLKAAMAGAR